MSPLIESPSRVTFGLFEVDLQSGELWKAGKRIKIQSQPFKVLATLLEHPGEVVTREDLQLRLWGKDTTVDFDHSLGTAINKIREALGDSAENPRFIETLARRGYRFITPVGYPVASATTQIATSCRKNSTRSTIRIARKSSGSARSTPRKQIHAIYIAAAAAALVALGVFLGSSGPRSPLRISQITYSGRISPGAPAMESLPATATDGFRIFSSVIENGRASLSQVSIANGEAVPLPIPSEIAAPSLGDLSPDGSKLLLRNHLSPESEQPLWVVPVGGGSALRVANILAHDATWMPDGNGILYAAGDELFVTYLKDGVSSSIATVPGRAFWLRWSPDGLLLRFTIIDPLAHTMSLWELPAGTHTPRPILSGWSNPASECCGTWTPDGKYFIFQSARDGNEDLWRLRGKDTSGPTRITNGPLRYEAPIAARTGHRIFFLGLDTKSELLRYATDKREFIPLNTFLSQANRVNFSRDRQWVAWTDAQGPSLAGPRQRRRGASAHSRLHAGLPRPLVTRRPAARHHGPRAGPSLAALLRPRRTAAAPSPSILKTATPATPTGPPTANPLSSAESPISWAKRADRAPSRYSTSTPTAITPVPGSEGLFSPRWSPDGRYIAAISLDQRRLMLYDVAARTWRLLAETSVADPVWSSDSKAIYIHAFMSPTQPIYRVDVPSGQLQQVADLASFRYRRDCRLLLLRHHSRQRPPCARPFLHRQPLLHRSRRQIIHSPLNSSQSLSHSFKSHLSVDTKMT